VRAPHAWLAGQDRADHEIGLLDREAGRQDFDVTVPQGFEAFGEEDLDHLEVAAWMSCRELLDDLGEVRSARGGERSVRRFATTMSIEA
jgi:hypothetical protein